MWKILVILAISFVIINSISKSRKYVARFGTIMNYDKFFIWLFDSTYKPLLKMSCHNTVKIVFFTKNFTSYLPPFQTTYCKHTVKLCSRYYIARVVTTLNYAKKNVIFITIHNFINKEKRININQKIFCQFLFYKKTA